MIYICYPYFSTIFLLIFRQILTRSFFVLLGYVPLLGWERKCIGMMVWVNWLRKKDCENRFYDAWLFLYQSITLISSPDQRFSVAIRRFLETGLYLIVQFLMTLFSILFLFYLCLDTWSTSSLICAMKLYIFVFRSLKFDRVKLKWKESATDANAVSHRHPMDEFPPKYIDNTF